MIDEKFLHEIIKLRASYADRYRKEIAEKGSADFLSDQSEIYELIHSLSEDIEIKNLLKKISTLLVVDSAQAAMPVSIAFLGPEGTFTSQAVVNFYGGEVARIPQKTIGDVFKEVEAGNATYGVVPVENSTEGAVTFTLDELMETELQIIAEQYMRISICLMAVKEGRENILRIYSHPQPVGQCKGWLKKITPMPR